MKQLQDALQRGHFILDLSASNVETACSAIVQRIVGKGLIAEDAADDVVAGLLARERESRTAIGHALAVPHVYLDVIPEPIIVFVRLAHPINVGAPDGIPTRFLFMLLGPTGDAARHLDSLAAIARVMSNDEFRYDAGRARNQDELIAASAFCGVVFALVSGQPLVILGGTGPLLVFTAILYRMCVDLEIPFLPTYAWVGLWSATLLVLLAVTYASC